MKNELITLVTILLIAVTTTAQPVHLADTVYYEGSLAAEQLEPPTFPGGIEALEQFIENHISYSRNGVGGYVYVSFVIDTDGTVFDPRVERDLARECGKEALRIVSLMPRWNPAMRQGKPIPVRYTLPFFFDIEKNHLPVNYWQTPRYETDPLNPSQEVETGEWRFYSN